MRNNFQNPAFQQKKDDFRVISEEQSFPSLLSPIEGDLRKNVFKYNQDSKFLGTILEDSNSFFDTHVGNHTVNMEYSQKKMGFMNSGKYKFQENSAGVLEDIKMLDLKDATPREYDSDSDNEKKKKKFFNNELPSPILPNPDFQVNRFRNTPMIPPKSLNPRPNLKQTLNSMDDLLQMGSTLREGQPNESLVQKKIEPGFSEKYSQQPMKPKPKDPNFMKNKKNEKTEAQKKYEQMTYDLYYKEQPNKEKEEKSGEVLGSVYVKPQDFLEFSRMEHEEKKVIPKMEVFEFKSNKNDDNDYKSPTLKTASVRTVNEILAYDSVFQLSTGNSNNKIFPPLQVTQQGASVCCLDCKMLISCKNIEEHLFHCPSEEKIDKVLPFLNEQELAKWLGTFEKNLALYKDISLRHKENVAALMKNPYFSDTYQQIQTIRINNGLQIVTNALKRIISNYSKLESLPSFTAVPHLQMCIKTLMLLSKEKPLLLKYSLDLKDPVQHRQNLLHELQELELQTEAAEKELLEEIAMTSKEKGSVGNYPQLSFDSDGVSLGDLKRELPVNNGKKDDYEKEELKREFYSLAVKIKLSLPPAHKGREKVISELYDELESSRVHKKDWEKFIRKRLAEFK